MNSFERLENLLMEDKASQQSVSIQKLQDLLLKIAKQQQEIERLNSLLAQERDTVRELTDRWNTVRTLCGSQSDDTVIEVYELIKQCGV